MIKKILPGLMLLLGAGMFYLYPLNLATSLADLVSRTSDNRDYDPHASQEGQEKVFVLLTQQNGDMFNARFFNALKNITNDIFFLPQVDRTAVTSLTTRNVNFRDIIEDGFEGGPLIPDDFLLDSSAYDIIKKNILKSSYVGQLVSRDFKSALIVVPLLRNANGQEVTRRIQAMLPSDGFLKVRVFGHSPFLVALHGEFLKTMFWFVMTWLMGGLLFCILLKRFCFGLFLAPIVTGVIQLVLFRLLSSSLHPFVMPVILGTMMLSAMDQLRREYNMNKMGAVFISSIALFLPMCLVLWQSTLGDQAVQLCVTGSVAILGTHFMFNRSHGITAAKVSAMKAHASKRPLNVHYYILAILLILGLVVASGIFIGNRGSGPTVLRDNTTFNQTQKFVSDHFSFTADFFVLSTISFIKGCTDPQTMRAQEDLDWYLGGFPGVRFVSSLAMVVKRLNVFFHENNLKWHAMPREPDMLRLATSNVNPKTGLLDDAGLVMPVRVYLENHNPDTLKRIYEGVKQYAFKDNILTLRMSGGTVMLEAMLNQTLMKTIQLMVMVLLAIIFIAACLLTTWRQSLELTFLCCVILSLTLAGMALAHVGLTYDTVMALALASSICFYLLGMRWLYPDLKQMVTMLMIFGCLMTLGGVLSHVTVLYSFASITLGMLLLTWLIGFNAIKCQEDLPAPSVGI